MQPIELTTDVNTGTGNYVLFEAPELARHAESEIDWFVTNDVKVSLANMGLAVFIEVAVDGFLSFRLTTGDLTDAERAAVRQTEDGFWLNIKGYEMIFGSSEAIPSSQDQPERFVEEFGQRIPIEPGRYRVIVYRLIGVDEEVDDDAEAKLPAYVVVFRPLGDDEEPPQLSVFPTMSMFLDPLS